MSFCESALHPECAVRAIVVNSRGQVLLIRSTRKWSGNYVFPGGRVKLYETLDEALRRELKEEVGLEIETCRFAGVAEDIQPPPLGEGQLLHHLVILNFLCTTTSQEVEIDGIEAEEFTWEYPESVLPFQVTSSTYRLLQDIQMDLR